MGEDNFYYQLNSVLLKRSDKETSKIEGYMFYLMGGLEALDPLPQASFFRGIGKTKFQIVQDNYEPGISIHWSGMTSVSRTKEVSMEFALEEGPGGVLFQINARSGRS